MAKYIHLLTPNTLVRYTGGGLHLAMNIGVVWYTILGVL